MGANLDSTRFEDADIWFAYLDGAKLDNAHGLDLGRFIEQLQSGRKEFLDSQKSFLDSLSWDEMAKFNLTPEKLATFRSEAGGA